MSDNRIYQPYLPLDSVTAVSKRQNTPHAPHSTGNGAAFGQILQQELTGIKFSQHALNRLQTRNIELSSSDMAKLSTAVNKAAQKGAKESLILMNNELAFVVSVANKTVITAMDGSNLKDNVFTNIDSAVIV